MRLHNMRRQYDRDALDENRMPDNPMSFFGQWFEEALAVNAHEANAVVLATTNGLRPSARIVLLKEYTQQGFVFFTNYESRKGKELKDNPYAALLFYWPELERQVRVEGSVERLPRHESAAYFDSRPEGSRLSAIVSPQSHPIPSREALEALARNFMRSGKPLQMPDYWGGLRLKAESIEFWQGRPNRLHDRILYALDEQGLWQRKRLAP